ncbi:MAG TPA: GntR family transcriptional regulator [Roseiflexaceae bacterium]|nr:GntR family transcriptional regulator [Roseiflexaceae bacterium]
MIETARAVRGAEIFTALKKRIIQWEYPPGYRFTEEELCREFSVSRSPVRETLRMLEEHGLVDKVPYRGCTVKQPDIQAINELYDVRAILEAAVVEQLAAGEVPGELLDSLARTWHGLGLASSYAEVEDVDLANEDRVFHETLAGATGNQTLLDMLQSINERLHFMRMFDITTIERLRDTCRQHQHILDAIRAGDAPAARQAMRLNIEGARQQVKHAIKEALAKAYLAQGER